MCTMCYTCCMVYGLQQWVTSGSTALAAPTGTVRHALGGNMAKGQPAAPTVPAVAAAPASAPAPAVTQAAAPAAAPTVPATAATVPAPALLYAGTKVPGHRAGHNAAAWAAITPLLPTTAAALAALPQVKACGGAKANGLAFVGYALRRGWLTATAPQAAAPAAPVAPAS